MSSESLNPSPVSSEEMVPVEIVSHLDRYIVGQHGAKRAVAVALRNRWRRRQLPTSLQEEIYPKNILLIGPTGVGKTEIARRISRLTRSPFLKVEASKFTEVGYVGRDVESMLRDLTELAVNLVKREEQERFREEAEQMAEERVLDILFPPTALRNGADSAAIQELEQRQRQRREDFRRQLHEGRFDDKFVEIEAKESFGGMIEVFSSSGIEEIGMQLKDSMPGIFGPRSKKKKVKVGEARRILTQEEADKLIDMDRIIRDAIQRVEQTGIIFLDEIDKIAGRESGSGPNVSREGVQRDLLPIIEGSTVATKYGMVRTDHILFLAAGAFNVTRPSDLIPELQGRFPIRVDVTSLNRDDLIRILTEPENSLVKQYRALLETEGVTLNFTDPAVARIAGIAVEINEESENIGARRLHTVMEKLLEEVSFHAPELRDPKIEVTREYVDQRLKIAEILAAEDVRKRRTAGFHITKEDS